MEIAKEALICPYVTNAEASLCCISDSDACGKVAGLNRLPGGLQLPPSLESGTVFQRVTTSAQVLQL